MDYKVVIIEDDPTSAKIIELTLQKLKYNIIGIARTGEEGYDLALSSDPDIILMDINLPGEWDGITTTERIKKVRDIPVIYITANSEDTTLNRAVSTEPIGYLLKPYSRDHLRTIIELGIHLNKLQKKLKESEQLLNVTLQSISNGVVVTNHDGEIVFFNNASNNFLQLDQADLKSQRITDLCPLSLPDGTNLSKSNFSDWASTFYTGRLMDVVIEPQPGLDTDLEIKAAPITNLTNEKPGIVFTFRDVTSQKVAEKRLLRLNEELELRVERRTLELRQKNIELESEIIKRRKTEEELKTALEKQQELNIFQQNIVTTISHEFRTPMTTILSSTELIERLLVKNDIPVDSKLHHHTNQIKKSVKTLVELLNDVLLVEKMKANQVEILIKTFNPKEFFTQFLEEAKIGIGKKHVIEFISNNFPHQINSDPKLIQQIINNLLSNAFKYSEPRTTVYFSVFIQSNSIIISVKDEGIGINKDDIPRLFDTFFRSSESQNIEGTGIGLTILKRAVDLLSGTITVESEKGKGTTFSVTLPITQN